MGVVRTPPQRSGRRKEIEGGAGREKVAEKGRASGRERVGERQRGMDRERERERERKRGTSEKARDETGWSLGFAREAFDVARTSQ